MSQSAPAAEHPERDAGFAERGGDAFIRHKGRDFLVALYGTLRALKLYPAENQAVQKALADLTQIASELYWREHELELRVTGEFIFLNSTRLRLDLDNYTSFSRILSIFRDAGVGVCRVREAPAARDWTVLLSTLQAPRDEGTSRHTALEKRLADVGITAFEIGPPADSEDDEFREKAKEAAKRIYSQSVSATKEVISSVRMGRSPNLKKIKRVVQGLVDQILNEETSLLGLTTLREYDEYTFTHSVNVCIFALALGRKLGLGKRQLYDLGMAALMHDIGKSRVPVEIINKAGGLSETEWYSIQSHPWLGVLALFGIRGQSDLPYRAMVVAFEHHMKTDLTGYPKHIRPRTQAMFSRIVAVADGFDAATSRRSYQANPWAPADVLKEMRVNPKRGMDQVIVKAFISMVGHYPVGTLVVLDTFELGVVHAANPLAEAISRPIVRIISDMTGNLLYPGHLVDLAQQDPATGNYLRSIIKIADPDRYGIRISDYFV